MSPLPDILILGETPFPVGCAASNLLRGHARAIQSAGLSVGILADQLHGRYEDRLSNGCYAYRGIPYWPVQRRHQNPQIHRLLNALLAWRDDRLDWLGHQESLVGVKAILFYPGSSRTVPVLLRLWRFCRHHGIRLFVFAVEWDEPGRYGARRFALGTLDGEVQRRWVNPRLSGVLCITEFLKSYYCAKGTRTALVPPLVDLTDPLWQTRGRQPNEVRILFSGKPVRDRHDLILRGVREARRAGANLVLEYLGSTREVIAAIPHVGNALLDEVGDGVRFHGRVPFATVAEITSEASFGILFREDSQWSKACFPSKVPELLALGVPLICNLTSDLHRYLVDGCNSLLVPELSADCLASVLRRAAALTQDALQEMSAKAIATAQRFESGIYGQTYREFFLDGMSGRTSDGEKTGQRAHIPSA